MKHDWTIHAIIDAPEDYEGDVKYLGNFHTHGLDKYNQKELCIVLALSGEQAGGLINSMGERVAKGETIFTEGIRRDVLEGEYDVEFISFDNDPTLYVILPDSENRLPMDDGCLYPYSEQLRFAKLISDNQDYV